MAEVSRKVLGWRLKAMPYLYTAFYDSHVFGCPIARPLWFNFPSDSATLRLQEQWMMGTFSWKNDTWSSLCWWHCEFEKERIQRAFVNAGDALLISPVLYRGVNVTVTYFPTGIWYNMYNYSMIDATSSPRNVTLQVALLHNHF